MRPVRLLIIRSTLSYGGPERQITGFYSRLDPSLFQSVICGYSDDLGEDNPMLTAARDYGMETAVISASRGLDRHSMTSLVDIARDLGVNMLCPQDYRSRVYAFYTGRRLGLPVAATIHGYTGHTAKVRVYEGADRMVVARSMDSVICVSRALMERMRRSGVPAGKLRLVYNSVDMDEIIEHSTAGPSIGGGSGPVVSSIGRLSVEKGHKYLLDAWPGVVREVPSAKLVLVGDGPESGRLKRQARTLRIDRSVEFAGFADDPIHYIERSDLCVLPSLWEGLPVALLEIGAAGKPVVASDVGGVGEVVASGKSGLLIPSKNPTAITDAILEILRDTAASHRMGEKAREIVGNRFCFQKNVPVLQEAYLSVMRRRKLRNPGMLEGHNG